MKHRRRKTEGSFAGLFDDQMSPTPAYFRIKEVGIVEKCNLTNEIS